LAALTVMNMLIGVICEMVLNVGEVEREAATLDYVTEKLQQLMETCGVDENNDMMISKQEFLTMLTNQTATTILHEVGVDVLCLVDVADTIFEPDTGEDEDHDAEHHETQLSFDEFVKVVLDLRGTKTSRVKDVVNLRKHINGQFARLEQRLYEGGLLQKHSSQNVEDDHTSNLARHQTVSFPEHVSAASIYPVAAHEREIAFLRAENLQLKEQLANLEDHISSRHSDDRVQAPPTSGTFSNSSKSDLVQQCIKHAMSRPNLASDPLRGSAQPGPVDRSSSRGASATGSAHSGATSVLSKPVLASSRAQPRHS